MVRRTSAAVSAIESTVPGATAPTVVNAVNPTEQLDTRTSPSSPRRQQPPRQRPAHVVRDVERQQPAGPAGEVQRRVPAPPGHQDVPLAHPGLRPVALGVCGLVGSQACQHVLPQAREEGFRNADEAAFAPAVPREVLPGAAHHPQQRAQRVWVEAPAGGTRRPRSTRDQASSTAPSPVMSQSECRQLTATVVPSRKVTTWSLSCGEPQAIHSPEPLGAPARRARGGEGVGIEYDARLVAAERLRIVIVGGSISGLVLAHALQRMNIDYVLLEGRGEFAPQIGASVGILPNGARVLDQIGVYSAIEAISEPLGVSGLYYPDGYRYHSPYARTTHESVRVHCADGTVYTGDLVVGADGIHSKIRSEIWRRLGPEDVSSALPQREAKYIKVEFSCVFGISRDVPELKAGEQTMNFLDGRGALIVINSKDDVVFWLLVRKMELSYTYETAPKFGEADIVKACTPLLDVVVQDEGGVTFRKVWTSRTACSMLAMEEAVFQAWTHGRMVCIGDSIHKMTVNFGQGANMCIEDVAVLVNLLHRCLAEKEPGEKPSDLEVSALLDRFNKNHVSRVTEVCQVSETVTRFHARDGAIRSFAARYVMPWIMDWIQTKPFRMFAGGQMIEFLPVPERVLANATWGQYAPQAATARWPLVASACGLISSCYLLLVNSKGRESRAV
ncbi:uncharacterized protein PpBr36_10630 [Pyricularia pennisetigena]|uniref:uncharacterized protein n=1 Tax=Pyricularia pennisetigena TaxID=1578925 RepID=UPI0011536231|nr:uncharacterized protein PpBr36_10630 [Pyricularia pennisetigena]TLS21196.1 hypothetical protein PpBr36_10630 [Pyricularia pennisetigena]